MGLTGFNRARKEALRKAAHTVKSVKEETVPVAPTAEPVAEKEEVKTENFSAKKEHVVGKKKGATNADTGSK